MVAVPQVVIVAGGLSYERETSLASARRLRFALSQVGVNVEVWDYGPDILPSLVLAPDAMVIPLVLGQGGEDGGLQTMLELLNLQFVGSTSAACRLAWDKSVARTLLERQGFRVPKWMSLQLNAFQELGTQLLIDSILDAIGLPLIVKPSRGGSGMGIYKVTTQAELPLALTKTFAYGDAAIIEEFVTGIEVAVGVVESANTVKALPPLAVSYAHGNDMDPAAEYSPFVTAAEILRGPHDRIPQMLAEMGVRAHNALGLRHWSRADFILTSDGDPVLLEVAIVPAMTDVSPYPHALEAGGLDLGKTVAALCLISSDQRDRSS